MEPSAVIKIDEQSIVVVPPVQPTITKTIFSPVRIVDNAKFRSFNVKSAIVKCVVCISLTSKPDEHRIRF